MSTAWKRCEERCPREGEKRPEFEEYPERRDPVSEWELELERLKERKDRPVALFSSIVVEVEVAHFVR